MTTQDPTGTPPPDGPYGAGSSTPPSAPYGGSAPGSSGTTGSTGADHYSGGHSGGAAPYDSGSTGSGPRNGIGVAALVVGIASLALSLIPFVGFIGLVAIVLGVVGLSRVRKRVATNKGMAITGIVLGTLAIIAAILWVVVTVLFASSDIGGTITECAQLGSETEQQQCIEDGLGAQG